MWTYIKSIFRILFIFDTFRNIRRFYPAQWGEWTPMGGLCKIYSAPQYYGLDPWGQALGHGGGA